MSIYPNPADNFLTIDLSSNEINEARIIILNQIGQIVDTRITSTKSTSNFDVSNYPAGLYQISVVTSTEMINQSLLVK